MKKLSPREFKLAVTAALVLGAGVTFLVVRSQLERLEQVKRQELSTRFAVLEQVNLLTRRPEYLKEFQRIRSQLPRHPEGRDIKTSLSRQVQNLAGRSGLQITSLTPEEEQTLPELDLTQMTIRCTWEGTPAELVGFLYQLHQLGAVTDIRELRVRSRSRNPEKLSGSFSLDFAYTRTSSGEAEPPDDGVTS